MSTRNTEPGNVLDPVYLKEKWYTYLRVYCKEGFIDRWLGDSINNPNNDSQCKWQLNSFSTFWRLNNGDWVETMSVKNIQKLLMEFKNVSTADEIWNESLNQK